MAQLSLNQSLAQITADGRSWVSLARVDAVSSHASWGHILDVTLQPRGVRAQARLLLLGSGDGQGVALPVSVGDEVVVVFPGGDPNEAVALGGLPSRPRQVPAEWDNDTIRIDGGNTYDVEVRAGGTRIRVERSGDVHIEAAGDVFIDGATTIRAGNESAVPLARFNELKQAFDSHIHNTSVGPSATPGVMAPNPMDPPLPLGLPSSVATTKVRGE